MIKRLLTLLLFLTAHATLHAQVSLSQAEDSLRRSAEITDSMEEKIIRERTISLSPVDTVLFIYPIFIAPDTISAWKNKKEFAYLQNLDSLLKALQETENDLAASEQASPKSSFMNEFLQAPVFRTLFILLALFFVAVILNHLLQNQGMFKKMPVVAPIKEVAEEEDEMLQKDYDKLVHQACKLADYRMAVRYLFLKTLQQLKDKNLINFARDKTNSRYAQELPQQWQNDFSKLILHYEYVWYGNFAVSREQFESVQQRYSAFLQKI